MSNTTLGIDLGSNSIGWAIRDTMNLENQIIDYGVLTFEKGVATEKGNEFPKVQKRTESRGKRRNYQAEKYRKFELLEFLILNNMCPLTIDELNKWKKYIHGEKRKYPQSEAFVQWLRFDFNGDGKPDFDLFNKDKNESYYIFRTSAIDKDFKHVFDKNPLILGRVLYQLVQRRGFRGRDEEEAKTMLQGSEKAGTPGRNEIASYIEKYKTLGAALYHFQKEKGGRIRQRYNLRKDYEEELKEICKVHSLDKEVYQKLWKAIIWQRPLRTQKGLVGTCIYEPNKKRVQLSHPLYEEYRTWVFINNLKIEAPEGVDKETYLKEKIYPIFYKSSNEFELKSILVQLKKDGANLGSKFRDKTKVISAKLLNSFKEILGDDWEETYGWHDIHNRDAKPEKKVSDKYNFEDIWHVLNTFDSQESLKQFALEKLNLDENKAEKFSKIKLNQGYATLSLSAIKKIIPFLQKGFLYSQAVYLANMYKVLGVDKITDDLMNYFAEEIDKIIKKNNEGKSVNNVVNSLIADVLNDNNRYAIDTDRELDDSERKMIHEKIMEVLGEKTWREMDEQAKLEAYNYVSSNFLTFLKTSLFSKQKSFIKQPRLHDQIWSFLETTYDVPSENKKYLWHPSEVELYAAAKEYHHYTIGRKDVYIPEEKLSSFITNNADAEFQGRSLKLLGSPEPISNGFKNPMALKTLHKLKKLINYLLQSGKIDEDTRIVIEIARELNDSNKRKALEKWNIDREKENNSFRSIIQEINKDCNTDFDENDKVLLKKIRLWNEQGKMCLYTGKMINAIDVFNGNLYDLEHTIPASMSFDSELKNLTLADSSYNRNVKGKLYPSQLPNYNSEVIINNFTYPPIIKSMERIFGKKTVSVIIDRKGNEKKIVNWKKIEDLEELYKGWRRNASFASTKERKDYCIQQCHYLKFELDYLKAKLHTFTLEEYKAGWKNSQLRDTQIVTKYALPYLKTIFKKVDVEKAEVVNNFKEIYQVKSVYEKKNRRTHSHHAVDAAILTLIPPFFDRDKILHKYFEAKDKKTGKVYHEQPKGWSDFSASKILFIEKEVFINNLSESRTTLSTYKKVRKRGKVVWLDRTKNMPKVAKGDTIRGQLHGESLYGAIKLPLRDESNKILFDSNNKMKLQENIFVVIRKPLIYKKDANSLGFKSLEEIEKVIVDRELFLMIKKQVEESDFKTAITNGFYMIDKNGLKVNKIRRIRCKENLKFTSAVKVHEHSFEHEKEYKRFTLAVNGENSLCLFYKNDNSKAMKIQSIMEVAESRVKCDSQYFAEPYYNQIESGKGKNKKFLPLYAVLRSGQKALFYKDSIEELKELSKIDLSNRLYKMYQFESDGRIKFKHHLAAGNDTELKKIHKEYPYFDVNESQVFLRLTQAHWNFAIEDKDFEMMLDGTINFII